MYTVKFNKGNGKVECYPYVTRIYTSSMHHDLIICEAEGYEYMIPITNIIVIIKTTKK